MSVQLSGLDWFFGSINKKQIEKVVHTGTENIASLVLISQDKLDTAVGMANPSAAQRRVRPIIFMGEH